MDKHLKRNKDKYNPYTLSVDEEKEIYIVEFKDSKNVLQKIEISKEVYDAFDKFELEDISQIHKIRKHIEHNEVYEETLFKRCVSLAESVDLQVERKVLYENLKRAINELPDIQKNRLKKYYFEDKTLEEIAKEENCSKVAIKYSLDSAIKNISKKIKF